MAVLLLCCAGCEHFNPHTSGYDEYYPSGNPARAPGILQSKDGGPDDNASFFLWFPLYLLASGIGQALANCR
jgi:hypothetical protein